MTDRRPATPEQRTAAVDHLCVLAEQGALDVPALEASTARALAATTEEELAALLLAVPGSIRWTPEDALVEGEREITTRGGSLRLDDGWQLARHTRVITAGGSVVIDLGAASFDDDRIDLELHMSGGSVRIVVPHAVHLVLGDVDHQGGVLSDRRGGSTPLPGMPVVHLHARVRGGQVVLERPQAPRTRRRRFGWFRGRATDG